MENHGGMIAAGELLIPPQQLSVIPTIKSSSNKSLALSQGNDKLGFTKYLCSYFEMIFTFHKILTRWGLVPFKERRAGIFYRP
jgi:hypothetical protein